MRETLGTHPERGTGERRKEIKEGSSREEAVESGLLLPVGVRKSESKRVGEERNSEQCENEREMRVAMVEAEKEGRGWDYWNGS